MICREQRISQFAWRWNCGSLWHKYTKDYRRKVPEQLSMWSQSGLGLNLWHITCNQSVCVCKMVWEKCVRDDATGVCVGSQAREACLSPEEFEWRGWNKTQPSPRREWAQTGFLQRQIPGRAKLFHRAKTNEKKSQASEMWRQDCTHTHTHSLPEDLFPSLNDGRGVFIKLGSG